MIESEHWMRKKNKEIAEWWAYDEKEKREYISMTAEQKAQNKIQAYVSIDNDWLFILEFGGNIIELDMDSHGKQTIIELIDFLNRQMNPDSVAYGDSRLEFREDTL